MVDSNMPIFILETDDGMRANYVGACRKVAGTYGDRKHVVLEEGARIEPHVEPVEAYRNDPAGIDIYSPRSVAHGIDDLRKIRLKNPVAPISAVIGRNTGALTGDQYLSGEVPAPTEYLFGNREFRFQLGNGGFVVSYTDNPDALAKNAHFKSGHTFDGLLWVTADKKVTTPDVIFERLLTVASRPEIIPALKEFSKSEGRTLEALLELKRW